MFSGLFILLKSSAYGKMRTVWTLPMALDVTRSIVSFSIYFHLLQIRYRSRGQSVGTAGRRILPNH